MKELLQELWNEFASLCRVITDLTDDAATNEEPYKSMLAVTDDTPKMEGLRVKLREAGIDIEGGEVSR